MKGTNDAGNGRSRKREIETDGLQAELFFGLAHLPVRLTAAKR